MIEYISHFVFYFGALSGFWAIYQHMRGNSLDGVYVSVTAALICLLTILAMMIKGGAA